MESIDWNSSQFMIEPDLEGDESFSKFCVSSFSILPLLWKPQLITKNQAT